MPGSIPRSDNPVADDNGNITPAWFRFLASLVKQPAPSQSVTVGASPFSYPANSSGSLIVQGGTVSNVSVIRGTSTINVGATYGIFPASTGDVFKVTYSVAPTMTFLPD